MLIKAAINGSRTPKEHHSIPVTPQQQAVESAAATAAGAGAIHLHVRGTEGRESLSPDDSARALEAIRAACPGVPVGISTGSWIVPDVEQRLNLIQAWEVLPDFASVNIHEEGAMRVIRLLIGKGIGVEAGVWNARVARALLSSGLADECLRVLIEPCEEPGDAMANLGEIEAMLGSTSLPRLLHGLDGLAWEMISLAARRGYDTRTGFEDTLRLPDGTVAQSNAAMVRAAFSIVETGVREE
ncbi:MAG: 3-keto-5-aminohexanoate cleavage protein [Acidobacteria bacterium]|nr:3-keto-5-aminohexanoate cleavage protein [Acidobacteriota bacterium]